MMKRIFFLAVAMLAIGSSLMASKRLVSNSEELKSAQQQAQAGDTIVLKNGEWKDVSLVINCSGTPFRPIVFTAETAGKVLITGKSNLRIGGSYLVVNGLNFCKGQSPKGPVWEFRIGNQVANYCRITNCFINDFNNQKRLDENYWIALYGQHNRIDHCSFLNKKNLGVLLAVVLDDERSRENYHQIDSNYFGLRLPLASNAGEIIRVGVSQHCTFNSFTQIHHNLFDNCDGEAEIISLKSCGNHLYNNSFKECQGSVSLRHGNNNTVEANLFWGNDKRGTGGVRIINEGNWVVNNLFYHCRGVDFRSPLAIMNGVFHSPAYRYLPVRDAVVAHNSFIECTPATFCEGSDSERTVAPANVFVFNNVFANTKDSLLYLVFDKTDSIFFQNNLVSNSIQQNLMLGFQKINLSKYLSTIAPNLTIGASSKKNPHWIDSLKKSRLLFGFPANAGVDQPQVMLRTMLKNTQHYGASWAANTKKSLPEKSIQIVCKDATATYKALQLPNPAITLLLTNQMYQFDKTITINKQVEIISKQAQSIRFSTTQPLGSLLMIAGGGSLRLKNLAIELEQLEASSLISLDSLGSSNHASLVLEAVKWNAAKTVKLQSFLDAPKASIADSIVLNNCVFNHFASSLFQLGHELDNKGYYNVEHMRITNCQFNDGEGQILHLYRGGNDESTMGPFLRLANNRFLHCAATQPLIQLIGVQQSQINENYFARCNASGVIISYQDKVRASHHLTNNQFSGSGKVQGNAFLQERNNNRKQ